MPGYPVVGNRQNYGSRDVFAEGAFECNVKASWVFLAFQQDESVGVRKHHANVQRCNCIMQGGQVR